jgi:protease I
MVYIKFRYLLFFVVGLCFLFFSFIQPELLAKSSEKTVLPEPTLDGKISLEKTLASRRSIRDFDNKSLSLEQIGQLAWAAQGITQKSTGFRTAPSAGAIYPMSVYLATEQGLFLYEPSDHSLQNVIEADIRERLSIQAHRQQAVAEAACDIIIAGSVRKLASKYGGRSRRYALLEAGHIAQNILLEATALGLGSVPIGAIDERAVARVCRLDDQLEPFYIICVGYPAGRGERAIETENEKNAEKPVAGHTKAALIIASHSFRDEELFDTKDVLEKANVEAIIASTKKGSIKGMLGGTAEAGVLIDELNVDDFDAVIFIGGRGAAEYFGNATALKIAREAVGKRKVVAAICIAPTILANAGVLQDKKATSFSSERGRLIRAGAKYTGVAVEKDGSIITASGPAASRLFATAVVEALREKTGPKTDY